MRALVLFTTVLFSTAVSTNEIALGRPGIDNVFIWENPDAQSEAYKLTAVGKSSGCRGVIAVEDVW